MPHFGNGLADILFIHEFETLFEDHLALIVHHVVVFQDVLADIEIARLHLALGALDGLGHPRVGDALTLLKPELAQHGIHRIHREDAHQVVLQRQVEL
ncbi:hypothetical protein D9M68_928710 [compost metagenome]